MDAVACARTATGTAAFDGFEPVLAPAATGSRRLAARQTATKAET